MSNSSCPPSGSPSQSYLAPTVASMLAWLVAVGLIWPGLAPAQSPAADSASERGGTVKVLMVGDSWAEFMWVAGSLRTIFAANGHPEILEEGGTTAISGSTAAEWAQPEFLALISDALANHPEVEVVQLTIGGNDFLAGQPGGGWHTGMSAEDFTALQAQVLGHAETVVDHILSIRPGLHVLLSQYDYTNFVDSLLPQCPGTFNDLGQPTPLQINTAATQLQDQVEAFAATRSRVTSVRFLGLMQFHFGFPDEGIEPGDLIPPGDLSRPSPLPSMFLQSDCFHLGGSGYDLIAQHLWDGFYALQLTGLLFTDGFESGDLSAWTPGR